MTENAVSPASVWSRLRNHVWEEVAMCSDRLAKAVIFLVTTAALLFVNETCLAAQGTGKISVYLLNPEIPGRGACIQMDPALPGTWACVYNPNTNVGIVINNGTVVVPGGLFDQLNDLFRDAYLWQKTCLVDFETSNFAVNFAQCM
jgi:hypothetical protein